MLSCQYADSIYSNRIPPHSLALPPSQRRQDSKQDLELLFVQGIYARGRYIAKKTYKAWRVPRLWCSMRWTPLYRRIVMVPYEIVSPSLNPVITKNNGVTVSWYTLLKWMIRFTYMEQYGRQSKLVIKLWFCVDFTSDLHWLSRGNHLWIDLEWL